VATLYNPPNASLLQHHYEHLPEARHAALETVASQAIRLPPPRGFPRKRLVQHEFGIPGTLDSG